MPTPTPVRHPIFARLCAHFIEREERAGQAEHRDRLLSGLTGRVIEIGAGTGVNFRHYPSSVTEVLAIEPEPYLRGVATDAAHRAPVPVIVADAVADALPAPDESFDAAIVSLVLCSVSDAQRALAELRRVLRPGGELRFYEHVLARKATLARAQRLAERSFWPHVGGGCHPARDTAHAIEQAGFDIECCERFSFGPPMMVLVSPRILGLARRA